MYRAVTRNIEVVVTPRFIADKSSPENNYFFWAYTIAITNNGPDTVQLKTRHWRITDAGGRRQEVRGPGVVGEEPVLKAGEVVRIYQRRAAADAVGLHGRHLRHGEREWRAFRHRHSGLFAGPGRQQADDQLTASGLRECRANRGCGGLRYRPKFAPTACAGAAERSGHSFCEMPA